jgi:D-alanyl-D-alanine carboxypeptidase/D-alanyl-D-alanine-endopeptidase (penicillin-binding protein 4)
MSGARVGAPAVVTLFPAVPFLKASNRCKTRQKSHAIWFAREADSLIITVGGSVRLGSSGYAGRVTVPHPALFTGAALAQVLEAKGIALEGTVRLTGPADMARRQGWHALAVRRTRLDRVLPIMLAWSQNMYAEHVIKAVGARDGATGSWQTGLARTAAMLAEQGFTAESFELADGSGLSRRNRASAGLLCAVLVAQDRSENGAKLAEMMGVAGVNGTLRKRFARAPYRGNVRAKTGYIRGVGALSGYANAKSGVRVAFSILINDFSPSTHNWAMKEIEDRIVRAIVDHAE